MNKVPESEAIRETQIKTHQLELQLPKRPKTANIGKHSGKAGPAQCWRAGWAEQRLWELMHCDSPKTQEACGELLRAGNFTCILNAEASGGWKVSQNGETRMDLKVYLKSQELLCPHGSLAGQLVKQACLSFVQAMLSFWGSVWRGVYG